MARRHGWQLPFHTFQVMAITVYFLLCIAFYAFFAPFLGDSYCEYAAIGIYSFLALLVFVLYVRCTALDPADDGIMFSIDDAEACNKSQNQVQSTVDGSLEEPNNAAQRTASSYALDNSSCRSRFCGLFCVCFVMEDCRKDVDTSDEDALFCTLCTAEVRKFSKHCRSCNKCVDGFDHHCRWLNNCVGRKNYVTFLALMATSLLWLATEVGVGIAVLVRCFTHKKATDDLIVDRLGNGFSRVPFVVVVVICTAFSLLASIPLGELFCFHMLLIRKGITTYEYVVAMRTQSEPPGPSINEDPQSLASSPISSAVTAISGVSSLGLQYRGAWCTPPRIFVDQDEIIPHLEPGRVPSTVDPDTVNPDGQGKRNSKRPVRISAWKLAKLDAGEATKAAAKARASSSVLKPINPRLQDDSDRFSSGNASNRSSAVSADTDFSRAARSSTMMPSALRSSYPPSQASREDLDTYAQTPSIFGSPCNPNNFASGTSMTTQLQSNARLFNPMYMSSANRSPLSGQMHEGNESIASDDTRHDPVMNIQSRTMADAPNSSVYWDQEAGRFVSTQKPVGSSQVGGTELLCTGQSIFFGGPMLNERSAINPSTVNVQTQLQASGLDRRRGSSQLPVFIPSNLRDQSQSHD